MKSVMTEQSENLIQEIIQVREQYFAEVGADKRRAWPKSIRDRMLELCAQKYNRKELAERTGVPYETIMQWLYVERHANRMFQPVHIKDDATVTVASKSTPKPIKTENSTVTVTLPDGCRVEGPTGAVIEIIKYVRGGG